MRTNGEVMCMYRQGTYCLTRINRALRKPVQWEINMTQGQLLLCALLPMPKKNKKIIKKGSLSHTWIILGDISLISFVLLSFIFLRMRLCSTAYANKNNKECAKFCYLGHIFLKIKWAHFFFLNFLPRQWWISKVRF